MQHELVIVGLRCACEQGETVSIRSDAMSTKAKRTERRQVAGTQELKRDLEASSGGQTMCMDKGRRNALMLCVQR